MNGRLVGLTASVGMWEGIYASLLNAWDLWVI